MATCFSAQLREDPMKQAPAEESEEEVCGWGTIADTPSKMQIKE